MDEYIKLKTLLAQFEAAEAEDIERFGVHIAECFPADRAKQIVNGIPAADVAPVIHGKWLWELADNGWANWMCSECGYTRNVDVHIVMDWEYCPYCGAHMRGE